MNFPAFKVIAIAMRFNLFMNGFRKFVFNIIYKKSLK